MQNNNIENELLNSFIDTSVFDAEALKKMENYGQKYSWFGLASILGAKAATESETDSALFSKTGVHSNKPIWLAAFLSKTAITQTKQEVYEALPALNTEAPITNNTVVIPANVVEINQELIIENNPDVIAANIVEINQELIIEKETISETNEIAPTRENTIENPQPAVEIMEALSKNQAEAEAEIKIAEPIENISDENTSNENTSGENTTEESYEKVATPNITQGMEHSIMQLAETQKANLLPVEETANMDADLSALSNALALAEKDDDVKKEEPEVENQEHLISAAIEATNELSPTAQPANETSIIEPANTASIAQYDYEATERFVLPSLPTQGFNTIASLAASSAAELKPQSTSPIATEHKVTDNAEPIPQLETQIPLVNKQDINAETQAFEPFHTVDYFAAVGIKIDDKLLKDDRIGQQLRSFNDWLKTMKNLHPEKLIDNSLQDGHGLVEIKTLDDEEVITEAMAIVYLKQGRKDKAVELLAKLSLLNSSKTAYFANLIQEFNNK